MGRKVGIIKPILLLKVVAASFCSFHVSFFVEERWAIREVIIVHVKEQVSKHRRFEVPISNPGIVSQWFLCVPQIHNGLNKCCFF